MIQYVGKRTKRKYVSAASHKGAFTFGEQQKMEISGSQYKECGFKQQNIILPVQNHMKI